MKRPILFSFLSLLLVACSGSDPTEGETDQSEEALRAQRACSGKTCGDTCTLCAPGQKGCFETAVVKACNAKGKCSASAPTCGGAPPAYQPCAGKACGASCTVCPPGDPNCFETAVLKECSATGACNATPAVCSPPPPPYNPCAGKACGASCTICPPGDPTCLETAVLKECSATGACSATPAVCAPPPAYDPCAGKVCGATCTICRPGDPNCFETAVLKQCNAAKQCTATPSGC
jgi:hypothetical protein